MNIGETVKTKKGWYVETDDGLSGPWNTEKAAEKAALGDIQKANYLHEYAKKCL